MSTAKACEDGYSKGDNLFPEWLSWGIVTVVTSILPFLVAGTKYFLEAMTKPFWEYLIFSDILALLFAVSVNCLAICLDRKRKLNIHVRRILVLLVAVICGISFFSYAFVSNIPAVFPQINIPKTVIALSFINLLIGSIVIVVGNNN